MTESAHGADADHATLDISSADELIGYAVRAQLALVSHAASHTVIAKAIGMARDLKTSTAAARMSHALAKGGSFTDRELQKLDEVIVTLAPTSTTHTGGLSSLAICLRGLRDRESLSDRVPAGWTQELLQSPAADEIGVLTQASALLSAFLAASELEKVSSRSKAIRAVHDRYAKEIVHVVYQLITLGYAPPTPRSVEALIMLGTLGGYSLDFIEPPLEYALEQPLGFRIWRVITTLVMLRQRALDMRDLRRWVKPVLRGAEELRAKSVYPGRSLDLELAIRVPADWSPPDNDWAGAVLLARANDSEATIRERGTAAMGLWQRAVEDEHRDENRAADDLQPLIREFEDPQRRPDASSGMLWVATTLKHVIDQRAAVCNDWPQTSEPWMKRVNAAVDYLKQQEVIPDDVRLGTTALFQHSLLQNAGIYRRQAIEALVAGGWTEPVARAFEKFLELEPEPWIRIRALFALGFLQHRDRGVEKTLADACQHAYSNLGNDPTRAQITEMHSALFAVGDCYGASGLEDSDVRRVRESIREVLVGLIAGHRTLHESHYPVSRACAYLLTFMILPRSNQREDLAEELLKELSKHPDKTTRELSNWALANRINEKGAVRPLVHARV
jgi:hypothetical protein